jgi:hypothetical protein
MTKINEMLHFQLSDEGIKPLSISKQLKLNCQEECGETKIAQRSST